MSLSWECVLQNYPQCRNLCVGASAYAREGNKLLSIKRMSDDVCKVRVVSPSFYQTVK